MQILILQNTPYTPKRRKEAIFNVKKSRVLFRRQMRICEQCGYYSEERKYKYRARS